MSVHKALAGGGWLELTLAEQLANVGSEVERAISRGKRGDGERSEKSVERALELMALTIGDKRWKSGRLRELCRMREVLCDKFLGENEYDTPDEFIQNCFLYFGILARKDRL